MAKSHQRLERDAKGNYFLMFCVWTFLTIDCSLFSRVSKVLQLLSTHSRPGTDNASDVGLFLDRNERWLQMFLEDMCRCSHVKFSLALHGDAFARILFEEIGAVDENVKKEACKMADSLFVRFGKFSIPTVMVFF